MTQPTSYTPATDFSDDELSNVGGRSTVRTALLDAELAAVATTLGGVLTNLSLNQRDDGEIRDGRVKLHTLGSDVRALLATAGANIRGDWVTATSYAVGDLVSESTNTYICATAHTSGTFATDLAADKWVLITLGTAVAASSVSFAPTATIAATAMQAAVEELDSDLAAATGATNGAGRVGFGYAVGYAAGTIGKWLQDLALSAGASFIGWIQAGTGAVLRTLQDKARDEIHAADFGATGSGTETAELKAAFDYAIANSRELVLQGSYTVDGPITADATPAAAPSSIAAGSLRIRCIGEVVIEVDAGSTPFMRLITCYTTAINSCSVLGGKLTLNLNSKSACGIYLRHLGGQGGTVRMDNVEVNDVYEATSSAAMEVTGIGISGRYTSVVLNSLRVDGVDRTLAAGVCKGISISELDGVCEINSPYVARVACGAGTNDADGIAVFGYAPSGTVGSNVYKWRNGSCKVSRPVLVDNKGRGMKFQLSDVVIDTPSFYRQMVVSNSTAELDFQVGGDVRVIAPYYEYRKNGATSPLHAGFYLLAWQGNCNDRPNRLAVIGGTVRSEVAFPYFMAVLVDPTYNSALDVSVDVDGLELQGLVGLGAMVSSCFVTTQINQITASPGNTSIRLRNVRGNITGFPWIGYTGAVSATEAKFSWSVVGCENTGAFHASTKTAVAIGGLAIKTPGAFMVRDNMNTCDYLGNQSFDYQTLKVGCRFQYDTDPVASVVTNGPGAMVTGAGIYAFVEVLGQAAAAPYLNIRVTKQDANAANTVFYTQTGTWGTIK